MALRPKVLGEFVGQDRIKEQLSLLIEGARARGETVDHLLFSGPPGLGKTTLAGIVANEVGVGFQPTSGPALDRPGDLAAILTNLEEGDVLFVDEIHRMPRPVEEVLYPALEDFKLDVVLGKGPSADRSGSTCPGSRWSARPPDPGGSRSRSGSGSLPPRLDYYSVEDLARIVRRSAGILDVSVDDEGAMEIARRLRARPGWRTGCSAASETSPRCVTTVRSRSRLHARASSSSTSTRRLRQLDLAVLATIVRKFGGGPSACRPWPPRSARRRTRSRTSSSRT